MKFIKSYLKEYLKDKDLVLLLYEHLPFIIFANLSFVLSYFIRFGSNIPVYNFQPFLNFIPVYSGLIIFFNWYFKVFNFKTKRDLINRAFRSVSMITMCSMAAAYIFRAKMQGIPSFVFIFSAVINLFVFVEILNRKKAKS